MDLFNTVLQHKHFPPSMNNGVICPLFKDGDPAEMANYRPITLLPVLYKILTKIINERMMHILDESRAVSGIQAGLGGGMNCHTQINTMLNVIKHSHRHRKELYLLSTDVRKAFDTVDYGAFTYSLQNLGFTEEVVTLINELQSGFLCSVRTPAGNTDPFEVQRGCKQGCSLSPLRFIVVYDIFLNYLEETGKGYKWELMSQSVEGGHTLNIPGCALADDMLLMSDEPTEFCMMVEEFAGFLKAVGLNLNPLKCHYTTSGVDEPPPVSIPDYMGEMVRVENQSNKTPVKYLGYLLVPGDCGKKANEQWQHHNTHVLSKFTKAAKKLGKSSCKKRRGTTFAQLRRDEYTAIFHVR